MKTTALRMMTIDDGDVAKTMAIADHKATRAIPPQIVSEMLKPIPASN